MISLLLLLFLAITAIAIVRSRDTLTAVMLTGLSSLISACLFLLLDAADVAFTEAAVGAGISTLLMLAALHAVAPVRPQPRRVAWPALIVVLLCGGLLAYGTLDLPPFGAAENPVHQHVGNHYLEQTEREIGVPNVVTAVLASYRGFDTLGEVVVVFTAGLAVLLLIGRPRRKDEERDAR
jgi:multicomponent Na+:H+ antiporter subunit B